MVEIILMVGMLAFTVSLKETLKLGEVSFLRYPSWEVANVECVFRSSDFHPMAFPITPPKDLREKWLFSYGVETSYQNVL